MKFHLLFAATLASTFAGLALGAPLNAQPATTLLLSNGDFETDANADSWPDDWGRPKVGGSYQSENGNHFLRLQSPEPGTMVTEYREVKVPAGIKAVELTWKQRLSNFKRGKNSWFDARIIRLGLRAHARMGRLGQARSGGREVPAAGEVAVTVD